MVAAVTWADIALRVASLGVAVAMFWCAAVMYRQERRERQRAIDVLNRLEKDKT